MEEHNQDALPLPARRNDHFRRGVMNKQSNNKELFELQMNNVFKKTSRKKDQLTVRGDQYLLPIVS